MPALRSFIAASVSMAALWGQGTEYPALKYRSNYLASYYLSHAPNTTPWWPSWSPDGKWIAVAKYHPSRTVDPHKAVTDDRTYNAKIHSSPSWSPEGKWIVYTANDDAKSMQ